MECCIFEVMSLLESAIQTALTAHAFDKKGHPAKPDEDGMPHIVHAVEVMSGVHKALDELGLQITGYTNEEILAAAILHDVVEDTTTTLEKIRTMYGDKVADIVDSVSRRVTGNEKESYRDFIYRAKANPAGRLIKLVDLLHNLSRTHKISDKKATWREKLEYKYAVAVRVLRDADEPTWEGASFDLRYDDAENRRVAQFFIADPNGKRIEITRAEAERVKASFIINN